MPPAPTLSAGSGVPEVGSGVEVIALGEAVGIGLLVGSVVPQETKMSTIVMAAAHIINIHESLRVWIIMIILYKKLQSSSKALFGNECFKQPDF